MAAEATKPQTVKVQFHYLKTPDFREILCNGVIGGVNPNGTSIFMCMFSERSPIPRMVEFDVPAFGDTVTFNEKDLTPASTESRNGVIRSVQVAATFDLETARNIRGWLDQHIKTLEAQSGDTKS